MGIIMERYNSTRYAFLVLAMYYIGISSGKSVPAIFIFGDSMVSVGNNFYLNSKYASPNIPPYAIDFSVKYPPGRYTNGRIVTDIIGQELGFANFTPPYLAPTTAGDIILKGVNYASAATGIANVTGRIFGKRINTDTQISYFEKTREDIISKIGKNAAERLLRRSLYFAVTGTNDVGFMPLYNCGINLSSNAYLDNLISRFRVQLTRLYNLGARKIVVGNCIPFGCTPISRALNLLGHGCIESSNLQARLYNNKLKLLLAELNTNLRNSTYVYADFYAMIEEIIQNYQSYGFENAEIPCCHKAGQNYAPSCYNDSYICPDRSKYVFWDSYHLTETPILIEARRLMDGGLNYISPMNIRQLVNL